MADNLVSTDVVYGILLQNSPGIKLDNWSVSKWNIVTDPNGLNYGLEFFFKSTVQHDFDVSSFTLDCG